MVSSQNSKIPSFMRLKSILSHEKVFVSSVILTVHLLGKNAYLAEGNSTFDCNVPPSIWGKGTGINPSPFSWARQFHRTHVRAPSFVNKLLLSLFCNNGRHNLVTTRECPGSMRHVKFVIEYFYH